MAPQAQPLRQMPKPPGVGGEMGFSGGIFWFFSGFFVFVFCFLRRGDTSYFSACLLYQFYPWWISSCVQTKIMVLLFPSD